MPKYGHYLSPASNTESSKSTTADNTPSSEERSPPDSGRPSKATSPCDGTERGGRSMPKQPTPFMSRKQRRQSKQQMQSSLSLSAGSLDHEQRRSSKVPIEIAAVHQKVEAELEPNDSMTGSYVEKETAVEKSSGDLQEFLSLDDIQFADESGSDYEAVNLKKVPKSELQLNQDDARSKLLRRREPKSKEVAV
ncbi:GM22235 [Drosophila sechellia]|uniref:GM22235 n=2 Tax=Drosophila sechellia TaxID=7238 RepID=B4IA70_DROSE|nr:GM22235 [Drosophila sechellia]